MEFHGEIQILRNNKAKNSYLDALCFYFKELRIDQKNKAEVIDAKSGEPAVTGKMIESEISGSKMRQKNNGNTMVKRSITIWPL